MKERKKGQITKKYAGADSAVCLIALIFLKVKI